VVKLLFIILLFLLGISAAEAQVTLDFSSMDQLLREKIQKIYPNKNEFSPSELDEILRISILTGLNDSAYISVDEKTGQAKIHTGFNKRVTKVSFSGIKQISLSSAQNEFGDFENKAFDQNSLIEAAERVRLYYRENGFYNTTIDLEFHSKDRQVEVFAKINEGVQTHFNDILVVTANPELKKKMENNLRRYRGSPYTFNIISELKKEGRNYLTENRYLKAELKEPQLQAVDADGGATLQIDITNPEQYDIDISIEGEPRLDSTIIETVGLANFSTTNPNVVQEVVSRVKNYYLSQGFAKVEVKGEEEELPSPFARRIKINILPGRKISIDSIEVTGKISRPSSYYAKILKENSSPVVDSGFYVKSDLENGLKNLVIERQNNGFLKSHVISLKTIYKENDQVIVSLNFDEGPLTQIQKITFENQNDFNEPELLRIMDLRPLEPLRLNQLEDALGRLKSFYKEHGYLEMAIINEKEDLVNYNEDNTLAHVKIKIYEGPKVIVGSIVVEGNVNTKDFVILNELDFEVGEILTPSKIEESIARLQRLGIFSTIDIKTLEEKTLISKRTVLIQVSDRDPGIFNLGIGGTNERNITLRAYTGVGYRNAFGKAQVFSATAEIKDNPTDAIFPEYKLSVGYLWPYLFNSRVKARFNVAQSVYVSDFNAFLGSEAWVESLAFEQDISSHFLLSWDFFTWTQYRDFSINPCGTCANNLDIRSMGLSAVFDYRDHPFNPTKGIFSRLSAEYGSPEFGGDNNITYHRTMAAVTHYTQVSAKTTWANAVRGGFLKNLQSPLPNGKVAYVPYEKKGFILGGQTTIRGFTPAEAFPNSTDLGTTQYQLTTESSMYLIKSEFRFPIWGNIGGAIFYDGGSVYIPGFNFVYRQAAGISARFNTPIGPVSLEIGWKIGMQASRNESPSAIHLSVGTF
jgi:outer membrane protein insertion porin family